MKIFLIYGEQLKDFLMDLERWSTRVLTEWMSEFSGDSVVAMSETGLLVTRANIVREV